LRYTKLFSLDSYLNKVIFARIPYRLWFVLLFLTFLLGTIVYKEGNNAKIVMSGIVISFLYQGKYLVDNNKKTFNFKFKIVKVIIFQYCIIHFLYNAYECKSLLSILYTQLNTFNFWLQIHVYLSNKISWQEKSP
jgi:hypothetical protein